MISCGAKKTRNTKQSSQDIWPSIMLPAYKAHLGLFNGDPMSLHEKKMDRYSVEMMT
jgi:hypothetical protein